MIRVFPVRNKWTPTDDMAFIGHPPLFRPEDYKIPVRISVTFTWDIPMGHRLLMAWGDYYNDVKLGGPAFDDLGDEFTPGLFVKDGVTITSRGCTMSCPWCFVPKREGRIRELEIKPGHIVQDNNLLACSTKHIEAVFEMLRGQKKAAIFSGGLDARLLTEKHCELFRSIRFKELWFACDSYAGISSLVRIAPMLSTIPNSKKRCYVMIGHKDETLTEAEFRLEAVYALGFLPFCQLFRGGNNVWSKEWKALARKWSRPAAYRKKKEL